ncbi:MAG: MFS transporter [Oscillospiraceae bacterium]|nr:MFS transporter [Oscillospiraceae bacterium]
MAKATAHARQRLNYPKTILTGFGFLATSIAWAIYDPYITKILEKFLSASPLVASWSERLQGVGFLARFMESQGEAAFSAAGKFTLVPLFIGVIMTFDNIFGVIFQPAFGKRSDRCHSRLGKRRPFILIGAPISALLFALIPWMPTLPAVMVCIILFVFVMSLWRAPVVALMPDLTAPELRSEGNAVINLMGGLGGGVGMLAGTIITALYLKFTGISEKQLNEFDTFPIVFAVGAAVMVAGMLVLLFFVKEKDSRLISSEAIPARNAAALREAEKRARRTEKLAHKRMKLSRAERISLVLMLCGLFFLFCGTNAVTTFFALFAQEILHLNTAKATFLMLIFALCSMAAAIPSGALGKRFGRKKTILAGLGVFLTAFLVFFGAFAGMSAGSGLSIKDYTTLNHAYADYEAYVTDWNDAVSAEIEAGTKTRENLLEPEEYLKQLDTGALEGEYLAFDAHLRAEGFRFDHYIRLADEALHQKDATAAEALLSIQAKVAKQSAAMGTLIYPVLIIAGLANMMITVNTLPLVLEIGGVDRVGTFTGYYYTATFSAQIASPVVYGLFRMFSGTYLSLFYYSPIAFGISLLFILFVRHGEAAAQEGLQEEEARA